MEQQAELGYNPKKLANLNRCRKYLQIVTVADIASGNGSKILAAHLQGKISKRQSRYRWAPQIRPDKSSWTLWNEAIITSLELDKNNYLPRRRQVGKCLHNKPFKYWRYSLSDRGSSTKVFEQNFNIYFTHFYFRLPKF